MSLEVDITLEREVYSLQARLSVGQETVVIVGPNGAGKSTLLRCIAGLEPSTAGEVNLNGTPWLAHGSSLPTEMRSLGMVFQDDLLLPHRDVESNIALGAAGDPRTWIDRFDLTHLRNRYPAELSGGERQRTAIARACARHPAVMLLDEPLSAVDVERRPMLRRQIQDALAGFRIPALIVTHDPAESATLGDRIAVLENGVITQIGPAETLTSHPRSAYVAELVGLNLYQGIASEKGVRVGEAVLASSDQASGPVFVTIHPRAVSVHKRRPEGSPRNAWLGTIVSTDTTFDLVRMSIGGPVTITATVTSDGLAAVGATTGDPVWVSVKASEVRLQPR